MKAAQYFGDDRLRHRVVYSKGSYNECIYCGNESDTREHIPPKVFLNQPFPENLPTVPACLKCNNSYSPDELLLALLIQLLKQKHYGSDFSFSKVVDDRLKNERNVNVVSRIREVIERDKLVELHPNILRVLIKLAIGHSVWEVSEGYYTDDDGFTSDSADVSYCFRNEMTEEEIKQFMAYFIITNEALPELGSRAFDERILVVKVEGKPQELILDWVEVQPLEYIYTCYKFGNEIAVKMVINNFLFAEVTLKENL